VRARGAKKFAQHVILELNGASRMRGNIQVSIAADNVITEFSIER
jgi:hypothetical protein